MTRLEELSYKRNHKQVMATHYHRLGAKWFGSAELQQRTVNRYLKSVDLIDYLIAKIVA